DMLRMLDAPAQVALAREVAEDPLVDVEHLAVGPVPDGMGVYLKAVPDGDAGGALEVLHRFQDEPGARRQIRVRREQPCAMAPESAVDLFLDRAHREHAVRVADQPVTIEIRLERG